MSGKVGGLKGSTEGQYRRDPGGEVRLEVRRQRGVGLWWCGVVRCGGE
jgi:hypothetical protein